MGLSREQAVYFRNKLRAARDDTLGDSEGYQQVLFVVEQMGRQMWPDENKSLGRDKPNFVEFVRKWHPLEGNEPGDTPFETRYETVKDGRNDAMHIGAVARTLSQHCVKLAITLEDAMMANIEAATVQDYMVRTPVRTYEWQQIGLIRQTMLESSFSYLPFLADDEWHVVSADAICRYLQGKSRKCRLTLTLKDARADGLKAEKASTFCQYASISCVLNKLCGDEPALVIQTKTNDLVGIANTFDLM